MTFHCAITFYPVNYKSINRSSLHPESWQDLKQTLGSAEFISLCAGITLALVLIFQIRGASLLCRVATILYPSVATLRLMLDMIREQANVSWYINAKRENMNEQKKRRGGG